MTTIAVFGNCQIKGLVDCLRVMSPDLTFLPCVARDIRTGACVPADIMQSSDVVLFQTAMKGKARLEAHIKEGTTVAHFPSVYFNAFHPDFVFALHGKRMVGSPLGNMSSAICLFAWMHDFTVGEAIKLFNEDVYRELGYLDYWQPSVDALIADAETANLDLAGEVEYWSKTGCFMHCPVHPKLIVLSGIARALHGLFGWNPEIRHPENFLVDEFFANVVWPIYPGIAEKYGLPGEYVFKTSTKAKQRRIGMSLENFVESSYKVCEAFGHRDLICPRLQEPSMQHLLRFRGRGATKRAANPYQDVPDYQRWKLAFAPAMKDVDPVVRTRFTIGGETKVATAGSCFAQHIARTLKQKGLGYYVAESGDNLPGEEAKRRNYGVFSARYGNIYTARQLNQTFDRAYDRLKPDDFAWERNGGLLVDPFRPREEPDGFATMDEVEASRQEHFGFVRAMFEQLDVFVFTLGLTEAWRSKVDGAVFPLAPGVAGGAMDNSRYEFVNFTARETADDLAAFLAKLRGVNSGAKAILTVSPVPLVATYENQHVLVSTTYSKAALRVAADEICKTHDWVDYFPSYEIITGSYNRGTYFGDDFRAIKDEGVEHVMGLFLKHFCPWRETTSEGAGRVIKPDFAAYRGGLAAELAAGREIICDEEEIERSASRAAG